MSIARMCATCTSALILVPVSDIQVFFLVLSLVLRLEFERKKAAAAKVITARIVAAKAVAA